MEIKYFAIFNEYGIIHSKSFSKSYTERLLIFNDEKTANRSMAQLSNSYKYRVKEILISDKPN